MSSGPTFEFQPGYPPDVECAICLSPWTKPTELAPCGHIFCVSCLPEAESSCPTCRATIASRTEPNRVLRNIVASLPGRCVRCGWSGVCGQFSETHTRSACDAILAAHARVEQPRTSSGNRGTEDDEGQRSPPVPPFLDDEPPPPRQSSDILAAPDSAGQFMAFFASPAGATDAEQRAQNATSAADGGERVTVLTPRPAAVVTPVSDSASSPSFGQDVTLAVAVISGVDGAAPPLDYFTVSTPLQGCSLSGVVAAVAQHVVAEAREVEPFVTAVVHDKVITELFQPLASLGVQQGSVMYLLCGGVETDAKAVECFRVRSVLDGVVRMLRLAEAEPRGEETSTPSWRSASTTLPQLVARLDALSDLVPPVRQLKRRTCADAHAAEEILDRLQSSRAPPVAASGSSGSRSVNTSFNAIPAGTAVQAQAMAEEPWLAYNLSQRFYDALLAAFAAFDAEGRGTLNRSQLTMLLRWMNLPSDQQTVGAMLSLFCTPPQTATARAAARASSANNDSVERRLTYHQLCVWVQRHQRQPLHDYGLNFQRYFEALDMFHSIDGDRTGGFAPPEAEDFIKRFAAASPEHAKDLVTTILGRAKALADRGNPMAAATTSESSLRLWAHERGEEIPLDIVLRVLCADEQGWDLCAEADEEATASPPPAGGQQAQPSASGRMRSSTTTTGELRLPRVLQASATANAAAGGANDGAPQQRHVRLRASTTTTRGTRGAGDKKDCAVM